MYRRKVKDKEKNPAAISYPETLVGFSRLLKGVLWSDKGAAIAGDYGCGWNDGGCWSLAAGLKMWLVDAEVYCVYNKTNEPQHVLLKIPTDRPLFIDGTGILSLPSLRRHMRQEGVRGPVSIEPFRSEHCIETPNGIELWKDASYKVCELMQSALGDGRYFLWRLMEVT
jgi:hypothetical protein